ncbi:MAG: hypothetical protein ACHRXM_18490 [Isosphaerales bacterium]
MTAPTPSGRALKIDRLTSTTIRQIAEIAEAQHGLADVRVVEWAVDHLHRSIFETEPALPRRLQRKVAP